MGWVFPFNSKGIQLEAGSQQCYIGIGLDNASSSLLIAIKTLIPS